MKSSKGKSPVHTVLVLVPKADEPLFSMAASALMNFAPDGHRLFSINVLSEEVYMNLVQFWDCEVCYGATKYIHRL